MNPPASDETNAFFNAFLAALLWSENDGEDASLSERFTIADIHPNSLAGLRDQCDRFVSDHRADLLAATQAVGYDWEQAGHDFALSRNGHGAGYFDRDLGEVGDRLQEAAQVAGPADAYVGDDGKVHVGGVENFGAARPARSSLRA